LRSFHLEVPSPKADLSLNINRKVAVSSRNEQASILAPLGIHKQNYNSSRTVWESDRKTDDPLAGYREKPCLQSGIDLLPLLPAEQDFLVPKFGGKSQDPRAQKSTSHRVPTRTREIIRAATEK
jgi:hypothetical protein